MELYTDEEFARLFLDGLGRISDETWQLTFDHVEYESKGPRMSGMASCARQQYYSITNMVKTNPSNKATGWSQLLGAAGQAIATKVLIEMGYDVTDCEKTVTLENGLIVGHIDGKLSGQDLGDAKVVWDNKLRNIYALHTWLTQHLVYADEAAYMQMQQYLKAEQLDMAIITVMPFDLSAARVETFIKRRVSVAEPLIHRIIIPADKEVQDIAVMRAKMLIAAKQMGVLPAREFDPHSSKDAKFPCGYCEWQAMCLMDGDDSSFVLPQLTEEIKGRIANG